MTKTMTLRLTGTMIAQSPICIVPPGAPERFENGNTANEVSFEIVSHEGKMVKALCVPSSTLRGGLRRACVNLAFGFEMGDPVVESEIQLPTYNYNAIGGAKGSGKEVPGDVLKRQERRAKNPVIALFGASQPWDMSHAYIGSAYADPAQIGGDPVKSQIVGSRRTDDMVARQGIESLLAPNAREVWASMRETVKDDAKLKKSQEEIQKQMRGATPEEKAKLQDEIQSLKEQRSGKNSILMPLSHAVMPRGTLLKSEIILHDVLPHEAGLLFAAMDDMWFKRPYFGGKIAHGYGLLSGNWSVSMREGRKWTSMGDVTVSPHVGIEASDDTVEAWIQAWEAYRESGDMDLNILV